MNNFPDIDTTSEAWAALDQAVSWLSDVSGWGQCSYAAFRARGAKTHDLMVRCPEGNVPLSGLVDRHPVLKDWMAEKGWSVSLWDTHVKELMHADIISGKHQPYATPEGTEGLARRPAPGLWRRQPQLQKAYWAQAVAGLTTIHPSDQWALDLHALLSTPWSARKAASANKIIRRIWEHTPNWEEMSGQSLRAWAYQDPKWSKTLDTWGCSYRHQHNGVPLVCWALDKKWMDGLNGWRSETGMGFGYAVPGQLIPASWQDDAPTAPLWMWACRLGHVETVDGMLQTDPSLLNSTDNQGRTGLHWAAGWGQKAVVDVLLNAGASASVEDENGTLAAELVPTADDDLFDTLERHRHASAPVSDAPSHG